MDFHVKQQPYNMHLGQNLPNNGVFSLFNTRYQESEIFIEAGTRMQSVGEIGKAFADFNKLKEN